MTKKLKLKDYVCIFCIWEIYQTHQSNKIQITQGAIHQVEYKYKYTKMNKNVYLNTNTDKNTYLTKMSGSDRAP